MTEMDKAHKELAELLFGDMPARQLGAFVNGLEHVVSRLRAGLEAAAGDAPGLRIRNGTTVDVRVPWEAVASVTSRRGSVDSGKGIVVARTADDAVLNVAVMKLIRIDIELCQPTMLDLPDGPQEITRVRCDADEPARFVARARERIVGCGGDAIGHEGSTCRPRASSPALR